MRFRDRRDAGERLAEMLESYRDQHPLVLGLPRGGVPVAFEVARRLDAPLDVFLVRKLGVPGHEELAMGAIATGGARILNRDIIAELQISPTAIDHVTDAERRELARRESLYRDGRPEPPVVSRTVILVDDGLATGASMLVAVHALRALKPGKLVVAAPVASREAVSIMRGVVDDCVCVSTPEPFMGVGAWYANFRQTTDDEVRQLLAESAEAYAASHAVHAPQH